MQISKLVGFTTLIGSGVLLGSCATQTGATSTSSHTRRIENVRTTAYCSGEGGCRRNATGAVLAGGSVRSAASDWSRFPLGTKFRIVGTQDIYRIDDYGGALIGTNTIDLYMSRPRIRRWGVRRVDIEVLEWGSDAVSLKVLGPRRNNPAVRRMVASLEGKKRTASMLPSF